METAVFSGAQVVLAYFASSKRIVRYFHGATFCNLMAQNTLGVTTYVSCKLLGVPDDGSCGLRMFGALLLYPLFFKVVNNKRLSIPLATSWKFTFITACQRVFSLHRIDLEYMDMKSDKLIERLRKIDPKLIGEARYKETDRKVTQVILNYFCFVKSYLYTFRIRSIKNASLLRIYHEEDLDYFLKNSELFPNLTRVLINSPADHIKLTNCENFTEFFWRNRSFFSKSVSDSPSPKSLHLSGCQALTDLHIPDGLESLKLSGCKNLIFPDPREHRSFGWEDTLTSIELDGCESLESIDLSRFKALTSLNLKGCKNLKSLDLKEYSNLFNLTSVDLGDCESLESIDLSECRALTSFNLKGCRNLKSLRLFLRKVSSCLDLSDCENLAEIKIVNYGEFERVDVSGCQKLTTLSLQNYKYHVLHNRCELLCDGCENITTLHLENLKISPVVENIKTFSKLEHLNLKDCLNGNDLDLTHNKNLTNLSLIRCGFNSIDIHECKNLTKLHIDNPKKSCLFRPHT